MEEKEKVRKSTLDIVLEEAKPVFIIVFAFAFAVNLLMLVTPLYSLQILDRVLSSQSQETLLVLTLLMLVLYVALTLLQIARSFTLIKLGEWLDKKLAPVLFACSIQSAALRPSLGGGQNLRDLQAVKGFLTSAGINTIFDAPWSIVYIIVLFMIHTWMGWIAIIGSLTILAFAVINAYAINTKLAEANDFSFKMMNQAEIATRNAEIVEAMGMMKSLVHNWHKNSQGAMDLQSTASYRNGIISNASKFFRMILQMLVTAIGAYLVLTQPDHMTVGGMIASSIMVGRALAPFDAAIEVWKQITNASKSYKRLKVTFSKESDRHGSMKLPIPEGQISVENVYFAPPATKPLAPGASPAYTLKGVNFKIDAGEILAIIGPSAAGKSSLSKIIVGVWKAMQGNVRLDGADVYTWEREDFGKHVGYLPQDVELFGGTIKENIGRLRKEIDAEDVVKAAQLAGAHDMILRLPNGYETDIGVSGSNLSAGQRQRVGLARAFFGDPKLVVLDEPNANLDEVGEKALVSALETAKKRKITTIIISHRPAILSSVDKILILQEGAVAAFGDRDDVMARFAAKPAVSKK